jgi:hypothetical protein
MTGEGLIFKCDEAACRLDARFYETFEMDERWEIIRAVLGVYTGELDRALAAQSDRHECAHCNDTGRRQYGVDAMETEPCGCKADLDAAPHPS